MNAPRDLLPQLGCGVGLRTKHYPEILDRWPAIDWLEVISENFMVRGGKPLHVLDRLREHYPMVLHGVSLSIGSTDPLNFDYLRDLKRLVNRVAPAWVSDHLCWTGVGGRNAHDLLPLPYTEETITHVVERVLRVQDFLGRRLMLENVSSYLTWRASEVPEWEFLGEIARRADSLILLDVNNVFVSAFNHDFDPLAYFDGVPADRVGQFHLAGHSDRGTHLLDTHDHDVPEGVWALYAEAVRRFGPVSTLIERDDEIPDLAETLAEAVCARQLRRAVGTRGESGAGTDRPPSGQPREPAIARGSTESVLGSHHRPGGSRPGSRGARRSRSTASRWARHGDSGRAAPVGCWEARYLRQHVFLSTPRRDSWRLPDGGGGCGG